MRLFSNTSRAPRVLAAAGACTLLIAGCGDDGGDDSGLPDDLQELMDQAEDMQGAAEEGVDDGGDVADGDDGDDGGLEIVAPNFLLPAETETPPGFEALPARCEPPEDEGTWITYAVPEDWENTSRSTGSGGGVLSTSTTLGFVRPDAGDVSVDIDPESRHPDGRILDSSGGEWESFDYESTRYSSDSETTTQITYESRGTVSVGDQDVEIWFADQDQAPDVLGSSEAKARVEAAELPNPAIGDDDKVRPASYVVTISWDAEDGDLDDGTMGHILRSLTMPECTRDAIVAQLEVQLGEDVDGDGEVATLEDLFG